MVLGAVARRVGRIDEAEGRGSGGSAFLVSWTAGQGETTDRSVSLFPEET